MNLIIGEDIFTSTRDRIVIPVNCVGVMGKGLAKLARDRNPEECLHYFLDYTQLRPGDVLCPETTRFIFAATKDHWRNPSQKPWITNICASLYGLVKDEGCSLAVPALGCGEGGLDWRWVGGEMEYYFRHLSNVDVYAPQ